MASNQFLRSFNQIGTENFYQKTGGIHAASAFTLAHHYRAVLAWGPQTSWFSKSAQLPRFSWNFSGLVRQSTRQVYLIIDHDPVHRYPKVKNWVKENEERIRLVFLPSYSPELNRDELLNQDVKNNALGPQRLGVQTGFMGKVRCCLRNRQCQPDIVAHYFMGKHVHYAA